ncbi:conserved domain protein [Pseudomonas phage phiPto-bp6g]|nr:conserved domain protein [Pseudomonas phage phiPto-bp6g]
MKTVFKFGINDSIEPVQTKGWVNGVYKVNWRCPFYTKWTNMLKRCYGKYEQYRVYDECSVCEEWLTFSNFKSWMKTQDWKGKHLDKDLLGGDLYCPENCVFISNEMNSFIKSSKNKHGLPRGVTRSSSGTIYARIIISGENIYLGSFETISDAKLAYNNAKIDRASDIFKDEPLLDELIRRLRNEH